MYHGRGRVDGDFTTRYNRKNTYTRNITSMMVMLLALKNNFSHSMPLNKKNPLIIKFFFLLFYKTLKYSISIILNNNNPQTTFKNYKHVIKTINKLSVETNRLYRNVFYIGKTSRNFKIL